MRNGGGGKLDEMVNRYNFNAADTFLNPEEIKRRNLQPVTEVIVILKTT